MKTWVYPGSFDPVTNGHIDIITRASAQCDRLVVAVLENSSKTPAFTVQERVELLKKSVYGNKKVEIDSFSGLLVDYMKKKEIFVVIKGLRAVSDFEYEFQMALTNKSLLPEIETIFMMTSINFSFLSSSIVKEIAKNGGNIDGLVPGSIKQIIINKFAVG